MALSDVYGPDERPSQSEIRAEVELHGSVSATDLVKIFASRGYQVNHIQRAIRRGLATGDLELGEKLRLCLARVAA